MAPPGNPPSPPLLPMADLMPLILEEWPDLSPQDLGNIADDLEATVIYIATHTDHTRTLVRRHLEELASLLPAQGEDLPAATEAEPPAHRAPLGNFDDPLPQAPTPRTASLPTPPSEDSPSTIDQLLGELEDRTDQLIQDFKAEMLPELEKKARSNLGTSLLMALGVGVILGLLLGGKRG